eukprot:gene6561-7240_t
MSDEDIIELGEDGAFEISSTKSVKQAEILHVDYESYDWEGAAHQQEMEGHLQALQPGEYAIYRHEKTFIVIFRLSAGQQVGKVSYTTKELRVELEKRKEQDKQQSHEEDHPSTVRVPLPDDVEIVEQSLQCKYYEDIVTIKFEGEILRN